MKRILAVGFSVCLLCSLWGCAKTDDPYVPTGNGLTVEEDYTAGDQIQSGTDQVLSLTYYPAPIIASVAIPRLCSTTSKSRRKALIGPISISITFFILIFLGLLVKLAHEGCSTQL